MKWKADRPVWVEIYSFSKPVLVLQILTRTAPTADPFHLDNNGCIILFSPWH